jgi:hypothetical protein
MIKSMAPNNHLGAHNSGAIVQFPNVDIGCFSLKSICHDLFRGFLVLDLTFTPATVEVTGVSQTGAQKHLLILTEAGLVSFRRRICDIT